MSFGSSTAEANAKILDAQARIDDARDVKRNLCKYAGSWREYLGKLGVVGRDVKAHPWGD